MNDYIVWNIDPVIANIGPLQLRYYGILFATAILIGFYLARRIYRKYGFPDKIADDLLIWGVVATVVGARLVHCFFYEPNQEVFGEAKVRPQILPLVEREHGGYRCCMFQGLADAVGARRFQLAILHRSRGGGDCLAHGELGDGLLDFLAERFVLLVEHADESEEQLLLHDFSGLCEQRGIRARKSFVPLKDGELCVVSACP